MAESTPPSLDRAGRQESRLSFLQKRGKEFIPLSKTNGVLAVGQRLEACEEEVKKNPSDAQAINSLRKALGAAKTTLHTEIDVQKNKKDIIPTCDDVLQAGIADFEKVYKSLYETIEKNPKDGKIGVQLLKNEVAALNKQLDSVELKPQRYKAPIDLFIQGLKIRDKVAGVAKKVISTIPDEIKERIDLTTGRSGDAVNIKGTLRMLEKAMLRRNHEGNADFVRDPVRFMVICQDMKAISSSLRAFRMCQDIKIIRLKDRFYTEPTSGGWRDIMLNFVLNDSTEKLQCEIQIVHKLMLNARKTLDGHDIYHNARNALEMLEYLGVGTNPAERAEKILENWDTCDKNFSFLRHAGCTLSDLKGAGANGATLRRIGFSAQEVMDVMGYSELAEAANVAYTHIDACSKPGNKNAVDEAEVLLGLLKDAFTGMRAETSLLENGCVKTILKIAEDDSIDSNVRGILLEALAARYNLTTAAMNENALSRCLHILGHSQADDLTLRKGARALFNSNCDGGYMFTEKREELLVEWCLNMSSNNEKEALHAARALSRFYERKIEFENVHCFGSQDTLRDAFEKSQTCLQTLVSVLQDSTCLEMLECVAWIVHCVASGNSTYTSLLTDEAPKILLNHVCTYCAKAPQSAFALYYLSEWKSAKVTLWECDAPRRLADILYDYSKQIDFEDTSLSLKYIACTIGELALHPKARSIIKELIQAARSSDELLKGVAQIIEISHGGVVGNNTGSIELAVEILGNDVLNEVQCQFLALSVWNAERYLPRLLEAGIVDKLIFTLKQNPFNSRAWLAMRNCLSHSPDAEKHIINSKIVSECLPQAIDNASCCSYMALLFARDLANKPSDGLEAVLEINIFKHAGALLSGICRSSSYAAQILSSRASWVIDLLLEKCTDVQRKASYHDLFFKFLDLRKVNASLFVEQTFQSPIKRLCNTPEGIDFIAKRIDNACNLKKDPFSAIFSGCSGTCGRAMPTRISRALVQEFLMHLKRHLWMTRAYYCFPAFIS